MGSYIKTCLLRACEECSPLINGLKARKKIRNIIKETSCRTSVLRDFWRQPKDNLGPFEELPKSMQEALAHAALFHIQEQQYLLTSSMVFRLAYGPLFRLGTLIIHYGWRLKGVPEVFSDSWLLGRWILWVGRMLIRGPRKVGRLLTSYLRFTTLYKTPFLHALWQYLGVNPDNLIQDYINQIPPDPRISPVFKCAKRRVASCGLVGIDFLRSEGRLYFIEGNWNPGLSPKRLTFFPEGDPVCIRLLDYAIAKGFSRIVFILRNQVCPMEQELEQAWRKLFLKKRVQLEVLDDPLVGSPYNRRLGLFMDVCTNDTLYVNGRYLISPVSRLIGRKGLMEKQINHFNKSLPTEMKILFPKQILNNEDLSRLNHASRFPNIIIKNIMLDRTDGIELHKSDRLPPKANIWPHIAYEYIMPDRIVKHNEAPPEEYVFDYRVYLLITPDGPIYLGAQKLVSSVPVPKSLTFGIVRNKSAYISNTHTGAYYEKVTDEEEQACKRAVLAVGEVIFDFMRKKHLLVIEGC